MSVDRGPERSLVPAGLFFALPALLMTGRALVSGGRRICAGAAPDTWLHLWVFWRAGFAVAGHDHGYLTTHTVTYPGYFRELSAIFDPLLSWMSLPLQAAGCGVPAAYNILVFAGLVFTCLAGYLLCATLSSSRLGGVVGGLVMGLNPFLFRLLARGYAEYAWWGVVPLAFWCLLESSRRPGLRRSILYGAVLLAMLLLSIYCSAYFAILAAGLTWCELRRGALRRTPPVRTLLRLHRVAAVVLVPLFGVWLVGLLQLGFKGIPYGRPFPLRETGLLPPETADMPPKDVPALGKDGVRTIPSESQAYRVLAGSLDARTLLSPTPSRVETEQQSRAAYFMHERVHAGEWWPVLVLAALAFADPRRRAGNARWLAAATIFVVLALGPRLVWNEAVVSRIPLPYAWCYQWIPGFSRLAVPGRAVLGASVALGVLAARGAVVLALRVRRLSPTWPGLATAGVLGAVVACLAAAGHGSRPLPTTSTAVPALYGAIRQDRSAIAVAELPRRGDLTFRTYCQTVHGKPIHGGEFPGEWVDVHGVEGVLTNELVRYLEQPLPGRDTTAHPAAAGALRRMGFGYVVLHADGYATPSEWAAACGAMEGLFGPPFQRTSGLRAWRLN